MSFDLLLFQNHWKAEIKHQLVNFHFKSRALVQELYCGKCGKGGKASLLG